MGMAFGDRLGFGTGYSIGLGIAGLLVKGECIGLIVGL